MTEPARRIPVKLHRNVCLIRCADPVDAAEILAHKALGRAIAGRLSETVLLVRPEDQDLVLDELRRLGHNPRLVR